MFFCLLCKVTGDYSVPTSTAHKVAMLQVVRFGQPRSRIPRSMTRWM